MPCCNCCEKTLNLGCFNACDAVYNTGIVVDALTEGTYILELTFGSVNIYYSVNVLDGETVIFTLTNLNENYTYSGQIIDPNGKIINIEVDGIEYDCIEFSTKIIINS
jgi:hypothetical protein